MLMDAYTPYTSGWWLVLSSYNQSQKLLRLNIFLWKSSAEVLDLPKHFLNSPSPWLNVMSSLEKVCQAAVAKNDQEYLQPADFLQN